MCVDLRFTIYVSIIEICAGQYVFSVRVRPGQVASSSRPPVSAWWCRCGAAGDAQAVVAYILAFRT